MKHGCMVMTLSLSSSRRSESRQIHRGRKNRIKFGAMSSPCWSFFRHPRHCPQGIRTPGKTVKDKFYCEFLKWLRESIRRKRPDKWKKNNWFLHHDNAPTNTSLVVRQFLASKNITVIPHPLFAWLRPLRLFPTPQDEITAERAPLGHDWGDPHLKTSRDAWNHGEHAGIAVYKIKGITSETVETGSYGKKLFNGQIPRIFR